MLTVLSDHHSFSTARRSLLVASCLTILMAGAKIEGDTIQFLGLGLSFSKPNLVFLLRLLSAYLFWVFFWITITEYYPHFKSMLIRNHEKLIEASRQEAEKVDDHLNSRDEDPGYYEPDGWWEAHYELEMKEKRKIARLDRLQGAFEIFRLAAVEIAPAVIVAVTAIVAPGLAASRLFGAN